MPFLHTWSLSVEEQFYLIAPILLLVLWKSSPKTILPVMCVLGIASLLFAQIYTPISSEMTFFLLPARAWELLAGTLLCVAEFKYGRPVPTGAKRLLPGFGVGLIIASIFLFTEQTPHPSLYTLIPVIGTACIVWYGHDNGANSDCATRLLTNIWPVRIGLISYGFYLWHFPIFAFGRVLSETPGVADKAVWLIATLGFTIANYVLIEKPFRNKKRIKGKTFIGIISGALVLIFSICITVNATKGAIWRFSAPVQRFAKLGEENKQQFIRYVNDYYKRDVENKEFTDESGRKILLLVDSA